MIGRYQTDSIAKLWDDDARFARWTQVEVAACRVWHQRGEIPDVEIDAIVERAHHQSAARVREIEKETNHDVVAFVRAVCESIGEPASRHVHRGLTSSDVIDTAMALTLRDSLEVVIEEALSLRQSVARLAKQHKYTPCAGRTHGIHAEPTTFGLKLAGWYTELGRHLERLERARQEISVGKLSGAVGNFSQTDPDFEAAVLKQLELKPEPIATQVVPRDRHATVMAALAILGGGLERFATEIRSLQRTDVREAEEPFRVGQTGSSAMPHKRNPIIGERITGMARMLRGFLGPAVENIALWHERDISHSSVERIMFPDAFHLTHYMIKTFGKVLDDLRVYPEAMQKNLDKTKGLLFSQSALGVLLAHGLDRHRAYKLIQRNAMAVWEGEADTLLGALEKDDDVRDALGEKLDSLRGAFEMDRYTQHIEALFVRAGLGT